MSIHRFINLDANPSAVEFMLDDLPSDPVAIESAVLARISYRLDWELYKMPWYLPTVEEVLERGEGDCKARALVLASVWKRKRFPIGLIHLSYMCGWAMRVNRRPQLRMLR